MEYCIIWKRGLEFEKRLVRLEVFKIGIWWTLKKIRGKRKILDITGGKRNAQDNNVCW